jgi:hypothetical protein
MLLVPLPSHFNFLKYFYSSDDFKTKFFEQVDAGFVRIGYTHDQSVGCNYACQRVRGLSCLYVFQIWLEAEMRKRDD